MMRHGDLRRSIMAVGLWLAADGDGFRHRRVQHTSQGNMCVRFTPLRWLLGSAAVRPSELEWRGSRLARATFTRRRTMSVSVMLNA